MIGISELMLGFLPKPYTGNVPKPIHVTTEKKIPLLAMILMKNSNGFLKHMNRF